MNHEYSSQQWKHHNFCTKQQRVLTKKRMLSNTLPANNIQAKNFLEK